MQSKKQLEELIADLESQNAQIQEFEAGHLEFIGATELKARKFADVAEKSKQKLPIEREQYAQVEEKQRKSNVL
jgi:Leu/Phe-tRNA-protein transferase